MKRILLRHLHIHVKTWKKKDYLLLCKGKKRKLSENSNFARAQYSTVKRIDIFRRRILIKTKSNPVLFRRYIVRFRPEPHCVNLPAY